MRTRTLCPIFPPFGPADSDCFSLQTISLGKRDIMWSCASQRQKCRGQRRGQPGRVSIVYVRSRVVFHSDSVPKSRDFAAPSKPPRPGAWSFERLISDSFLFSRLTARSRVPLCVTGYDLACRAASLHASPWGLPPTNLARRLPRHGALGRAPQPIQCSQSAANTEAPFCVASRIFCENQAARAAKK